MTTTDSARVLLPPSLAFERYGADGEVGMLRLSRAAKRNALDDATVLGLEAFFSAPPGRRRAPSCWTPRASTSPPGSTCPSWPSGTRSRAWSTPMMWHRAFERIESGTAPGGRRTQGRGGRRRAGAGVGHAHAGGRAERVLRASRRGSTGCSSGGGGSVRVPRLIGAHRMADMMLTGRVLSAQEGQDAGISHYLVDEGEGLAKALELATQDRGELAGHELRRAAGAAADRAGRARRGLPAWSP